MFKLVVKRLLMLVPQFLLLSFMVFLLTEVSEWMLATPSGRNPIFIRYWNWLVNIITTGDFGWSWLEQGPAMTVVMTRLPNTIRLILMSLLITYGIGIPLGIISGKRHGSLRDRVIQIFTLIGASIPSFALALLLILYFGFGLGWFPTGGTLPPGVSREAVGFSTYHLTRIHHMVLPALSLAIVQFIVPMKYLKSDVVDTYQQEFVTLARAKGASEKYIFKKHVFKNSLGTITSSVPIQLTTAVAGAIIIESLFAFPGLGWGLANALFSGDLNLASAFIFAIGAIVFLGAFIFDSLILMVNPRIKIEKEK